MKDHPNPCVCHEPEPVARAWAKIREELGIYVLHHDRQRVFDIVAHELAEQQRAHLRHQGYDTSCVCDSCSACLATEYIDLIDPEVQR